MGRWLRCALCALALCSAGRALAQPAAGARAAGDFARLPDDALQAPKREPVLLVIEGLEALVEPEKLRARLAALFGRPVVPLTDAQAGSALATLWAASNEQDLVLRLSMQELDLWQRIPRRALGPDVAGDIANAVIDMLWSERLGLAAASEVLDPFCPPGLICVDPAHPSQRVFALRRSAEPAMLDPWQTTPQHLSALETQRYPTRGDPWGAERGSTSSPPLGQGTPNAMDGPRESPAPRRDARWVADALIGGGVYEAGGFVRYGADALRRFARFDLGLAFVGARGQPDPAKFVRRALTAQLSRRFVMPALEVDLGGGFGTIFATRPHVSADVRPYVRGFACFAARLGRFNDLLVQSELASAFGSVGGTGIVEYALVLGLRQRF